MGSSRTIYTIGHSTRPFEDFARILRAYEIDALVDIRTVPKSRHNPQYHIEALRVSLPDNGIAYRHLAELLDIAAEHTTAVMCAEAVPVTDGQTLTYPAET